MIAEIRARYSRIRSKAFFNCVFYDGKSYVGHFYIYRKRCTQAILEGAKNGSYVINLGFGINV